MTTMNKLLERVILFKESLLFILNASMGYFKRWRLKVTMKFD